MDVDNRYGFPVNTTVEAGAFLVLTTGVEHTFGIGKTDAIVLFDLNEVIIDQTTWVKDDATVSWCRTSDGSGNFQVCSAASFGAANTP